MRADTQTITIDASPSKVFRFVSNRRTSRIGHGPSAKPSDPTGTRGW